ncbi:UNVERIFIED_CONTAM: hypothetical protein FKN15_010680 [Acipenser sinensis]
MPIILRAEADFQYGDLEDKQTEPDDACDDFYMARVNCKIFAFVHIAHAQYELSQGNLKKSTSILQKAWEMNAKPIELLETAMSSLRSGKKQLLSPEDKENIIDHTGNVKQILSSNSPETCLSFSMKTEERGNPNTDSNLLRKLIDLYSQMFASLPIEKHCKNESYARILVRFAELKAIQEPDDACDDFYMARVNCKIFAFVHIAHAQYELSQGIIHSDLKPANFVIVNASLKLIDFRIANQIQPDVTSIVKDSQVGTLNYMPPEAIKDNLSIGGKPRSKVSLC